MISSRRAETQEYEQSFVKLANGSALLWLGNRLLLAFFSILQKLLNEPDTQKQKEERKNEGMDKNSSDIHKFAGKESSAFAALGTIACAVRNCKIVRALRRCILRQSHNETGTQQEEEKGREDYDPKGSGRSVSLRSD